MYEKSGDRGYLQKTYCASEYGDRSAGTGSGKQRYYGTEGYDTSLLKKRGINCTIFQVHAEFAVFYIASMVEMVRSSKGYSGHFIWEHEE